MSHIIIPEGYRPPLSLYDTQKAIGLTKRLFEDALSGALRLRRVSAPLFVEAASGLNDDLNGVERPVAFTMKENEIPIQVVHSLAKWKRKALRDYGFSAGEGLVADMNAIRRDETLDNLHSIYVDQWDWEKIITEEERTFATLQDTVRRIAGAIESTRRTLTAMFPQLVAARVLTDLDKVTFVTAQQLEDRWPDLTPKQREDAITRECKVVFLMGIGGKLASGKPHDGRAPDYDDWALNGDLLYWNPVLNCSIELSSMGIRVDAESLNRQLEISGCTDRRELPFHKALLEGELPLTMGGGIGQSRLCMLLLGCAHVGEVQSSVWDEETRRACAEAGVPLL